jgi:hypothetical protein
MQIINQNVNIKVALISNVQSKTIHEGIVIVFNQ